MWLEYALVVLAKKNKSALTTGDLGRLLGVSQQTASRYLTELGDKGWINRVKSGRKTELQITDLGKNRLTEIQSDIWDFLSEKKKNILDGTVVSGIGEGAYYVGEYAQKIREITGYIPYQGTLNVRLEGSRVKVQSENTVEIKGFNSKRRSFGKILLTPIELKIKVGKIKCHIITPERSHHKIDLELISEHNIRKKFKVEDGDNASITFI